MEEQKEYKVFFLLFKLLREITTIMLIHNIWVLCSIIVIFLIIIQNPKSQNVSNQNKLFGSTRTAEESTTKATWFFIFIFFLLSIFIAAFSK
jgi:protein translocase SecG subunit